MYYDRFVANSYKRRRDGLGRGFFGFFLTSTSVSSEDGNIPN